MVEYEEIKKRFFYEGTELASFAGRYPVFVDRPRISGFYEELARSSFEWFCEELCNTVKAEYISQSDSKKRFNAEVCRYELDFFVVEEGRIITVSCNVTLKKGKKRILARFAETQRWDAEGEMMIHSRKKD